MPLVGVSIGINRGCHFTDVPPAPLVGVSTGINRGCRQNDSLADGSRLRCAFYLDPLGADDGALRIIPSSHAAPLHSTLHEAHQQMGGAGHTTGGVAAELGCASELEVPLKPSGLSFC